MRESVSQSIGAWLPFSKKIPGGRQCPVQGIDLLRISPQDPAMKYLQSLPAVLFLALSDPLGATELTDEEQRLGFQLIFDGTSFDGWEQSGNWVLEEDGSMFRKERGGSIRGSSSLPN